MIDFSLPLPKLKGFGDLDFSYLAKKKNLGFYFLLFILFLMTLVTLGAKWARSRAVMRENRDIARGSALESTGKEGFEAPWFGQFDTEERERMGIFFFFF